MWRLAVRLLVVAVATGVPPASLFGQEKYSTKPIECFEVEQGKSAKKITDVLSTTESHLWAYGTLELQRDALDDLAKSCTARFSLFVSEDGKKYRLVKTYSEKTEFIVGVQLVGFSDNRSKLAADFWWAAGDHTGHRAVVYELGSKQIFFRELGIQIIRQLPSCDYSQVFVGVTNSGEAIFHVPKSAYVDEGCPDQGHWLLDLRTGKVRRRQPK